MNGNITDKAIDIKIEAFKTVNEWAKQIITIASATLVLSATFIKDILSGSATHKGWLLTSWVLLLVSIAIGTVVLGSLASHLNRDKPSELDVYKWSTRITATLQSVLFLAGTGAFIWFVYVNLLAPAAKSVGSTGTKAGEIGGFHIERIGRIYPFPIAKHEPTTLWFLSDLAMWLPPFPQGSLVRN